MLQLLTVRHTAFSRRRSLDLLGNAAFAANGNDAWARIEFRSPPSDAHGSLVGLVFEEP